MMEMLWLMMEMKLWMMMMMMKKLKIDPWMMILKILEAKANQMSKQSSKMKISDQSQRK